jgi:hypothetical protein
VDAEVDVTLAPGVPPIHQKGVTTNRLIGGGRWLVVDYKADSGFEGHGVYGWDPSAGNYVGVWVDSMQSSIARSTGAWDPATRTMTFQSEATHQGQTVRYTETTQAIEDGTQVYRNLVPTPDGGHFEMIRSVYRRRSG